jgi:type IX secretion system PorP/SprF family membrane protein
MVMYLIMRKLKKIYVIISTILLSFNVEAQDVQFSQFYNAIQYQNPAFAGSAHDFRFTTQQRLQWPNLDSKYITSMFAADAFIPKRSMGVGALFFRDWQSNPTIVTNEFHFQISQEVRISNQSFLRMGIQPGIVNRSFNYNDFHFTQDFNNNGYQGNTYTDLPTNKSNYFDLAAGLLYYTSHFWSGLAVHHILEPKQSLYGNNAQLPYKLSFTAGYKYTFDKLIEKQKDKPGHHHISEISISPTMHYKHQGQFDQLDIGAAYQYHEIILGVWYRGIPFKKYKTSIHNNESAVFSFGYIFDNIRFTYSYDAVVSKLAGNANPRGAHELNITMLLPAPKNDSKPMKTLPCPSF